MRYLFATLLLVSTLNACKTASLDEEEQANDTTDEENVSSEEDFSDAEISAEQIETNETASNASQTTKDQQELSKPGFENKTPEEPPIKNSMKNQASSSLKTEASPEVSPETKVLSPETISFGQKSFGLRRDLAPQEAPEEYVVQYGDTLFELCEQLIDDGNFWPKLWSLNPDIKNPHVIWPGMRLRFYKGNDIEPPLLEISSSDQELVIDQDENYKKFMSKYFSDKKSSFEKAKIQIITPNELKKQSDSILVANNSVANKRSVVIPGFIFENEIAASCTVKRALNGEELISEKMKFICVSSEKPAIKQRYTALRFSKKVTDNSGETIGFIYQFVAQVSLDKHEGNYLVGKTLTTRLPLAPEDILVPYRNTQHIYDNESKGPIANIKADIVGFDEDGRGYGGLGQLVFVSKGSRAGMQVGQVLKIFENSEFDAFSHPIGIELKDQEVGRVKIVDTTPVGSVALIIANTKEVQIGDRLGREKL